MRAGPEPMACNTPSPASEDLTSSATEHPADVLLSCSRKNLIPIEDPHQCPTPLWCLGQALGGGREGLTVPAREP